MSTVVRFHAVGLRHCLHRIDAWAALLPAAEQESSRRYLRPEDRARFVVARTLTRRVCAACLDLEPAEVTFARTPAGKPFVAGRGRDGRRELAFNVSHSGDCVLLAWGEGEAVGADVEKMEPLGRKAFAEMAQTAFSPDECAALACVGAEERAAAFYGIWVRKEAVLKAEGCGLGGALRSFSVAGPAPGGLRWRERVVFPAGGRPWSVTGFSPLPGHAASVAVPAGTVVEEYPGWATPGGSPTHEWQPQAV